MRQKVTVEEDEAQTVVRAGNVEVVVDAKHVTVRDRGRRIFRRRLDGPRIRSRVNQTVNG